MNDEDRAKELAVYLNIVTQRWRETQYEPVTLELVDNATRWLLINQAQVQP